MIWQVVERVVGYLFILAILYICSHTILQWNDNRRMEMVKEELRKEFELESRDRIKQIIRLEIQLNDSVIAHKYRMDALESSIEDLRNNNNKE